VKILLTGAAGFIGMHVASRLRSRGDGLCARGEALFGVDRLDSDSLGP
jgi:nucleoside-diphosphate-sugar epimerase